MYLATRIFQALSGTVGPEAVEPFMYWIDWFDQQATNSSCRNPSVNELGDRLAGLLELVAADPSLWSERNGLLVSLPRALSTERYEIRRFVFYDIITAFILGLPQLVEYDTDELSILSERVQPLEWVHGLPVELTANIVQVNAWRTSCPGIPNMNGWVDLEMRTLAWEPRTREIQGGDSFDVVARLAVQESWRHAVLIYIYMGMCGVSSGDFRVRSSVRQIIRLVDLISSAAIDVHLIIPCVVAGLATPYEHQRAMVRDKLESFRDTHIWLCRGSDLAAVLDHVWHGAARDGGAVTWEDYVQSRGVVLPIP
ncbi:hypothetical protein FRC07_002785, partial [Ceratobasidium sp. 392]